MDDAQREYLDAINKMVTSTIPQQPPLTNEVVWLQYMIALAGNPSMIGHEVEDKSLVADDFLYEFRYRFRV